MEVTTSRMASTSSTTRIRSADMDEFRLSRGKPIVAQLSKVTTCTGSNHGYVWVPWYTNGKPSRIYNDLLLGMRLVCGRRIRYRQAARWRSSNPGLAGGQSTRVSNLP